MRIRQLTLRNFRAFTEHDPIPFSEHFTVIAGINGRGKTAILDALALLLQRLLPQITSAQQDYCYLQKTDVHHEAPNAILECSVNCAGKPISSFQLHYRRPRGMKKPYTQLPEELADQIRKAYGPDKTRSNDAAPIAAYYTTDRAAYRLPLKLPVTLHHRQAAAYHGALVNRTVDYKDLIARLRVMNELADGQQHANPNFIGPRALESIGTALADFLDGFTSPEAPLDRVTIQVLKQRVPLLLPQLSEGERSLLAMVFDLSRRLILANPELENPLAGSGVVLIDELELHLHPKWQLEIVEKLRKHFPNIQFIATTHSPFIVQTVEQGALVLLDDQIVGQYANRGLEEVASKVMGISEPRVTPRYARMLDTARQYFQLLETAQGAPPAQLAELKQQLDALSQPYADNPAYQAFLEMNRRAAFGE